MHYFFVHSRFWCWQDGQNFKLCYCCRYADQIACWATIVWAGHLTGIQCDLTIPCQVLCSQEPCVIKLGWALDLSQGKLWEIEWSSWKSQAAPRMSQLSGQGTRHWTLSLCVLSLLKLLPLHSTFQINRSIAWLYWCTQPAQCRFF